MLKADTTVCCINGCRNYSRCRAAADAAAADDDDD